MSSDDPVLEFSELLQRSRSRVYGLIYAIVLNTTDTEDLFQQTAALLWEKFDEFQPGTDFAAWALKVARYNAANFVRSRRRERQRLTSAAIDDLYSASVATEDGDSETRLEALKGCLAKLSDADRSLVFRCYGAGLPIKEVAQQQGRSANALYAALHRIRRNLLECVKRTLAAGDRPASSLS
ncbi:MAG: sigma-70 family RNA polymerase sigma factor [Pirellulales bacterium]|nr:sigma-70 family RNA polymerase sigma factor [Pirellulales bacterium]